MMPPFYWRFTALRFLYAPCYIGVLHLTDKTIQNNPAIKREGNAPRYAIRDPKSNLPFITPRPNRLSWKPKVKKIFKRRFWRRNAPEVPTWHIIRCSSGAVQRLLHLWLIVITRAWKATSLKSSSFFFWGQNLQALIGWGTISVTSSGQSAGLETRKSRVRVPLPAVLNPRPRSVNSQPSLCATLNSKCVSVACLNASSVQLRAWP